MITSIRTFTIKSSKPAGILLFKVINEANNVGSLFNSFGIFVVDFEQVNAG